MDSDVDEVHRWYDATGHAHVCVLRWFRTVGYAHYGCTRRWLNRPTSLPGSDIEFLGGTTGRIDGQPMTPEQAAQALRMLIRMDTLAGDAMNDEHALVVVLDGARDR